MGGTCYGATVVFISCLWTPVVSWSCLALALGLIYSHFDVFLLLFPLCALPWHMIYLSRCAFRPFIASSQTHNKLVRCCLFLNPRACVLRSCFFFTFPFCYIPVSDLSSHSVNCSLCIIFLPSCIILRRKSLSEGLELSGILAVFFCGLTLSHYAWHSLGEEAQVGRCAL